MDLERYPLKNLTNNELMDRFAEECAEAIQASMKCNRFGWNHRWVKQDQINIEAVRSEMEDIITCWNEIRDRLGYIS
jgi:hypothetical protein